MSSPEDDLKKFIEPMSSEERKKLYTELASGASSATESEVQSRFRSVPDTHLKQILFGESEEPEVPVYFVLGHGNELPTEYEERNVLPKGYTLITETQCGKTTSLSHLQKIVDASMRTPIDVFRKPTKQILKNLTGFDYFIYHEGDRIPSIQFSAFAVFPKLGFVTLSGVHKLPIQVGKPRIPIDKLSELSDEVFTESAVFPKQKDIKKYLQTKSYKEFPTIDLFTFMKTNGPGVYYFLICRALESLYSKPEFKHMMEVLSRLNPRLAEIIIQVLSTSGYEGGKESLKLILRGRLSRSTSDEEIEAIEAFLDSMGKEIAFIERTRAKSTQRQRQIAGVRKKKARKTRRKHAHINNGSFKSNY